MSHLLFLLSSFGMTLLIWMVQLIIYPGFMYVEEVSFSRAHRKYTTAMTIIVLPLMLVQAVTALINFLSGYHPMDWFILPALTYCWFVTLFWAAPIHRKLDQGKDTMSIVRLMSINWVRTIVWTFVFLGALVRI